MSKPPRGTMLVIILLNVSFCLLQTWSWPFNLAIAAFFAGAWFIAELVYRADHK